MNKNKSVFYAVLSFGAAFIWFCSIYITIPLIFSSNEIYATIGSAFFTMLILVLDFGLHEVFKKHHGRGIIMRIIYTARIFISILFSVVCSFGITVNAFKTQTINTLPGAHANYIQRFWELIHNSQIVLGAFILIAIALFLIDNFGKVLALIFNQTEKIKKLDSEKQVVTAKLINSEEKLRTQDSEIDAVYEKIDIVTKTVMIDEIGTNEYSQYQDGPESKFAAINASVNTLSSKFQQQKERISDYAQLQLLTIRSIQHELGNKLPVVKHTVTDLHNALKYVEANDMNLILDEKIRQQLPGEANDIDTFNVLFKRINSNLHYSISIVDHIKSIIHSDADNYKPSKTAIVPWLKEELCTLIEKNSGIIYSVNGDEKLQLKFDPNQVLILLSNIISNAEKHGFSSHGKTKKLFFEITKSENDITLFCYNTGAPLPVDFTEDLFLKPGGIAGSSANTGIGGYLIGMIAANHGAEISITSTNIEDYTTVVSITFKY